MATSQEIQSKKEEVIPQSLNVTFNGIDYEVPILEAGGRFIYDKIDVTGVLDTIITGSGNEVLSNGGRNGTESDVRSNIKKGDTVGVCTDVTAGCSQIHDYKQDGLVVSSPCNHDMVDMSLVVNRNRNRNRNDPVVGRREYDSVVESFVRENKNQYSVV